MRRRCCASFFGRSILELRPRLFPATQATPYSPSSSSSSSSSRTLSTYHDPRVIITARSKLGFTHAPTDLYQLRQAYVKAVKNCHPDLQHHHPNKEILLQEFRQVQQSYELLLVELQPTLSSRCSAADEQQQQHQPYHNYSYHRNSYGSEAEPTTTSSAFAFRRQQINEQDYRELCREWLNVSAELVEESLNCDMFQQWLVGRSDAAMHWRTFLQMYPQRLSHYQRTHHEMRKKKHPSTSSSSKEQEIKATQTQPLRRRKV